MNWKLVKSRYVLKKIPNHITKSMKEDTTIVNKNSVRCWGRLWLDNLKKNNYIDFTKYSIYQFRNKYKGETAYLVGASPSLRNNIKYLKGKKGVIITCGHALKFLLKNKIIPDFVLVIDSHKKQSKWIDIGKKCKEIKLVVPITVHPTVIKAWKGQMFFFRSIGKGKSKFHKNMMKINNKFQDLLWTGGNVMSTGYSMAIGMGFSRIVFTGMDYANGFDWRPNYADGSIDKGGDNSFNKNEKEGDLYADYFVAADISGLGTLTLNRMFLYKYLLDKATIKHTKIEHINATEGGILGAYPEGNLSSIKQMRLKDVN